MSKEKILDKKVDNPPYTHCKGKIVITIGETPIAKPCEAELTWERIQFGRSQIVRTTCPKCGQYDYIRER